MKYYAVTEDPNELMHYGILGMKWGVRKERPRHVGSRKRSPAYKKAQSKLGKMMKSGIKKAEANWKAYNSPEAKYARQTDRAIQQARKGKLKYGKLTDEQVRRVTERLDLERQARALSNTERTFINRLGRSVSEGIVTGVGQGFGKMASEAIGRRSVLKTDRRRAEQQDRLDREKEKRKIKNARREAEEKMRREFEQEQLKDKYEYERDRNRERERLRDAYEYGAYYDKDGKLNYEDRPKIESYYKQKYIDGETIAEAHNRQQREARRDNRRAQRSERREREKQYKITTKRIEQQQRAEEERERRHQIAEEAREEAKRKAAYRETMTKLASSGYRITDSERIEGERTHRMDVINSRPRRRRHGK